MEKKLPIFHSKECSDDFYHSFCLATSTTEVTCEACGRVHFSDKGDLDINRLAALKALNRENPDKYIFHPWFDRSIGWMNFEGKVTVFDCPCNHAYFIEQVLRGNGLNIVKFFERITKEEYEMIQQN